MLSTLPMAFSTRATQLAHVMPSTGSVKVFRPIDCFIQFPLLPGSAQKLEPGLVDSGPQHRLVDFLPVP